MIASGHLVWAVLYSSGGFKWRIQVKSRASFETHLPHQEPLVKVNASALSLPKLQHKEDKISK